MKILHRLVLICLAAGCATGAAADESHAALYSFSDLYRLTVDGAAPLAAEPYPQRVVATAQPAAAEMRFVITPIPGPRPWMLLLAGLAAAAWVAHRRLTRPL
jgi:hypothetical protein